MRPGTNKNNIIDIISIPFSEKYLIESFFVSKVSTGSRNNFAPNGAKPFLEAIYDANMRRSSLKGIICPHDAPLQQDLVSHTSLRHCQFQCSVSHLVGDSTKLLLIRLQPKSLPKVYNMSIRRKIPST